MTSPDLVLRPAPRAYVAVIAAGLGATAFVAAALGSVEGAEVAWAVVLVGAVVTAIACVLLADRKIRCSSERVHFYGFPRRPRGVTLRDLARVVVREDGRGAPREFAFHVTSGPAWATVSARVFATSALAALVERLKASGVLVVRSE